MRAREVVLIIVIIFVGLSVQGILTVKEKGFPFFMEFGGKPNRFSETKEIDFPRGGTIEVENSHGNVSLIPWEKEMLRVELEKIIYTDNVARAKEASEQIALTLDRNNGTARISTNRAALSRRGVSITTHLTIYAPAESSSSINLAHGDLSLSDMKGNTKVEARHSDLQVRNLTGQATIEHEHGDIDLESIHGPVEVHTRHGNLRSSGIDGSLTLNAEHETVEISRVIKSLDIKSRHSELTITEAGENLSIEAEHTSIRAENITGNATVRSRHRDIEVKGIHGTLKIDAEHSDVDAEDLASDAAIDTEYGTVSLRVARGKSFSVDLATSNGDIESEFDELEPVEEKLESRLTGNVGSGGPHYRVRTRYNDILLKQTTN